MKKIILSILLSLQTLVAAEEIAISFAPLPINEAVFDIEYFLPMSRCLQRQAQIKINFVYRRDYQDILDGFKDKTIDMAYLGPLPYLMLKKEYEDVEPIVVFKQKGGLSGYRCVLAKFKEDEFKKESQIRVALTQPLSTCGYFMSSILLKDRFNIDLSKQKYDYTMSHRNALLGVVRGDFLIAGARESTAREFESLGVEIIAKSELLPGFALVVNSKTMSKKEIESIREALLGLEDRDSKELRGILSNGVARASKRDYESIDIDVKIPLEADMK